MATDYMAEFKRIKEAAARFGVSKDILSLMESCATLGGMVAPSKVSPADLEFGKWYWWRDGHGLLHVVQCVAQTTNGHNVRLYAVDTVMKAHECNGSFFGPIPPPAKEEA